MYRRVCCFLTVVVTLLCLAVGVQAAETAFAAGESYCQLTQDEAGITIDHDLLLDLNGHHVTNATVAEGVTLQLVDSANDEYDAAKCGSFSGTVNGTVEQVVKHDAKNYLVIEEDGVYTAHRFYAGIDRISLVPDTAALGYKAVFKADAVINAMVESYGYRLWVNDYSAKTFTKAGAIEKDELTLRVKNILDASNDALSQLGATATIYGQATISFNVNGQIVSVNGAEHNTTLRQAVEAVNTALGNDRTAYTQSQVDAVKAMYNKFATYMAGWQVEHILAVEKFVPCENVTAIYGETLTLGQVFTALDTEYALGNVTVTVNGEQIEVAENWADTVLSLNAGTAKITITDDNYCIPASNTVEIAKADPTYEIPTGLTATYGETLADVELPEGFSWADASLSVGDAGTNSFAAIYSSGDANYNTAEVMLSITVTRENVDKFAVCLYEGEPEFLYRVGNSDAVKLGSLFRAVDGVQIGNVTVTVSALDGTSVSGTYTANSADWTASTLKFTGTGPVAVVIVDDDYCNPLTIRLEVVTGYNVTEFSQLKNRSSVLLNDITMSADSTYSLTSGTLYGNDFTIDAKAAAYTASSSKISGNYVVCLGNATLDNVRIEGAVYTTYGDTADSDYNRALVQINGNATIVNCHLSNTATPVRMYIGSVEIINSTLKGGIFANMDIRSGNVVLDNVTTINQVDGNDLTEDGSIVVGMGVVFYYEGTPATTTLEIRNGIRQYNCFSQTQGNTYIQDDNAGKLVKAIFTDDKYASLRYTDADGEVWANMGILSMIENVGQQNVSGLEGYTEMECNLLAYQGYVWTCLPDAQSIVASPGTYASAGQNHIAPAYTFDYNNKNYVAKTEGSNDYCYYENGTVLISLDEGETFCWDTSILTATKSGQTLPYTVTVDGVDYTGKSISFTDTRECTVVYTYTDPYNYVLSGTEVVAYDVDYEKTVKLSVTAVPLAAKDAVFTFYGYNAISTTAASTYTETTTVTADGKTYIMPANADANVKTTTIGGVTVNCPVVHVDFADNTLAQDFNWLYPLFLGVKIEDFADGGAGDSYVVVDPNYAALPDNLTIVTTDSGWSSGSGQTGAAQKLTSGTYKNLYGWVSGALGSDKSESTLFAQFSYKDNKGTVYYYCVAFYRAAHDCPSSCVTGDTLVTMADGTQKEIQHVTYADQLLAWDFYKGQYAAVSAAIIFDHGYGNNTVIKLRFSDGTAVKVVNLHQFMDATENQFVTIDTQSVAQYVGHEFVKQDGNGYKTVTLTEYAISQEYVEAYGMITAGHYNLMVNGMWSTDFMREDYDLFNYFAIGQNMMFDQQAMQADIAKYGLYTYEDFAAYLTYEQFVGFNVQFFKISVGKGLYTYEGILNLIDTYLKA